MEDEKDLNQNTSDNLDKGINTASSAINNVQNAKKLHDRVKNSGDGDKQNKFNKNGQNTPKDKSPSNNKTANKNGNNLLKNKSNNSKPLNKNNDAHNLRSNKLKSGNQNKQNNGKAQSKGSGNNGQKSIAKGGQNGNAKGKAKSIGKAHGKGVVKNQGKKAVAKGILKLIASNPPVAIALIAGIVIIIFIFLVAALFEYLTEGSVLLSLGEGIKNAVLAALAEMGVAITTFLNSVKDLLGVDGHFGYDAVSQKIEVSTDLYDENDAIQVGYVRMYEMEAQILRNSYTHAIYVDMKAKAKKEDWDYSQLLKAVTDKYGEEDGWQKVYSTQNYAMLAEVLDFGLNTGVYSDTGETYTAGSEEAVEAIRKYFLDDMFNGEDTSLMQQFYYLNYTEETDEDGNTYIQPHIYPYTWNQIYGMLGLDPDDVESDLAGESSDITYYDRQKAAYQQAKANCEDANGDNIPIYDLLQLDNFYDIMNYVNENGEPIDNQSVEDIILNDLLASEEVPFDTSEWYNDVLNDYTVSASYEIWDEWMYMYATPTMEADSDTYFVNVELALSDIYTDLSDMGIGVPSKYYWCNFEFGSWKGKLQGITWEKGAGGSATYNNRYLVALAPGIYTRDYWANTGGIGFGSPEYGTKPMDLVLRSKETEMVYYIPICQGDTKAHTYPYGIVQTGMCIPNSKTLDVAVQGANFGKDFYYTNLGLASDYKSVCKNYDALLIESGSAWCGIQQMLKGGPIEWCYRQSGMSTAALNEEFDIMGVIVY